MRPTDLLAQIPLFQGLADDDREALAGRMTERTLEAGAIVFAQGDPGTSMYIVRSGEVELNLLSPDPGQPPLVLKGLHTGEYFGELALFDDKPRSATARVRVDTVLLELTREDLGEHLGRSKTAAMTILAEMASRLRETNAMLSQRAAKDVVKEFENRLTWSQHLADRVAEWNGSWGFILFLLGLSFAWAGANRWLPHPFDDYPYQFYNLFLAVMVAVQGPLIVMSQNRQSDKDRATAESDFRVNLKNEVGIEKVLAEMGALRVETHRRLQAIEQSLGADGDSRSTSRSA